MSKEYNLAILTDDQKMYYSRWIYNGLSLKDIYYVHNYNVVCVYAPFKLELFYLHVYSGRFILEAINDD